LLEVCLLNFLRWGLPRASLGRLLPRTPPSTFPKPCPGNSIELGFYTI
jgi:hypothetical protein